MQILTFIGIGAMIIAFGSAVIALCYMFAMYLDSRDTHIEPIVSSYQNAKVGQVLSARK